MNTRRQYLALVLFAVTTVPGLAARQVASVTMGTPPPTAPPRLALGTGVITGVVVDAVTSAPIPGAVVFLNRQVRDNTFVRYPRQLTDAKGRFAFTELPASDGYTIAAGQFGYFDGGYGDGGQPGTTNRTMTLADGQWITDARVALARPASIGGIVTDETGEPLAGLYVRVLAKIVVAGHQQLATGPSTTTDDRGQYRISSLPPGQYVVVVPSVQASLLAADAPASASGPAGNAALAGGAPGRVGEPPPLEPALETGGPTRMVVGRFAVPPPPRDGQLFAYPIAFYGGASDIARAVTLDLKLGDERTGIDIKLEPVAATTISGTVQANGDSLQRLQLRLLPAGLEEAGEGSEAGTAVVAADGTFTFHGVTAGAYTIEAPPFIGEYTLNTSIFSGRPPGRITGGSSSDTVPAGPAGTSFVRATSRTTQRFGRTAVTVTNRPLTGVVVVMRDLTKLYGYATLDTDPAKPDAVPSYGQLRAEPAAGVPSLGRAEARVQPPDYEIAFETLLAGQYFIRANLPAGWVLKSITLNGRDHTTTPIDTAGGTLSGLAVTITNRVATLSGTVRDAQSAIERDAVVVLFPADPAQWSDYGFAPPQIKAVAVRGDGTYRIANLPAGDYLIAAVPGDDVTQWQAPGFFKRAARAATRLHLDWSESRTQDLRTQPAGGGQ